MAALSRIVSALLLLALAALAAIRFGLVTEEMNPFSPLALDGAGQWFVDYKLAKLRDDPARCAAAFTSNAADAASVPDRPPRQGCGWTNAVSLRGAGRADIGVRPLACDVAAATAMWTLHAVQPAAREILGSPVVRIQHFGTYSCRDIGGSERRSQHAAARAIDIAGFRLADGRTVSVRKDWQGGGARGAFLDRVYAQACGYFRITLGPGYNAAHADHFHFDRSGFRYCP